MQSAFVVYVLAVSVLLVAAKDIWIQVGQNTSDDASAVFTPQRVTAKVGDTVWFNFTHGNHTATQSTFAAPCIRAHDSNITINGFDSGFRDAGNAQAVTNLPVPILVQNVNEPMWFFDWNTCADGGVGVINNDESSNETVAGFQRNAARLNGTESLSSSSSASSSATGSGSAPSATQTSNDAQRLLVFGGAALLPSFFALLL
ncbi:hypothetical protein HGRIS_002076 [Hohenbuehelia grisea]|uniref:Phytocyanin domain-containing protein n=1 Tax=Hohenbuehelia grisea TaxID=104357 RepID=A0ABR3JKK0_9AGAR